MARYVVTLEDGNQFETDTVAPLEDLVGWLGLITGEGHTVNFPAERTMFIRDTAPNIQVGEPIVAEADASE